MSDAVVINENRERLTETLKRLNASITADTDKEKLREYSDFVKEKTLAMLHEGSAPWLNPHDGTEDIPFDPISGYIYRGFDMLWLKMAQAEMGSKDPRWLTFYKAKENSFKVKDHAKATRLVYYKALEDGSKKLKMTYVFNGSQIENMPQYERHIKEDIRYTALYHPTDRHARNTLLADLVNYTASLQEQKPFEPKGLGRKGHVEEFIRNASSGVFFFAAKEASAIYKKRVEGLLSQREDDKALVSGHAYPEVQMER